GSRADLRIRQSTREDTNPEQMSSFGEEIYCRLSAKVKRMSPRHNCVSATPSSKRAEKLSDVLREDLRRLQRREVSAGFHLRPALDVEEALGPVARRLGQILWKERERGRHRLRSLPFFDLLMDPGE